MGLDVADQLLGEFLVEEDPGGLIEAVQVRRRLLHQGSGGNHLGGHLLEGGQGLPQSVHVGGLKPLACRTGRSRP